MDRRMKRWIEEWIDGYKNGSLVGWIYGLIDRQKAHGLPANSAEETKLCLTTDKRNESEHRIIIINTIIIIIYAIIAINIIIIIITVIIIIITFIIIINIFIILIVITSIIKSRSPLNQFKRRVSQNSSVGSSAYLHSNTQPDVSANHIMKYYNDHQFNATTSLSSSPSSSLLQLSSSS
jgi:hypothetical protein